MDEREARSVLGLAGDASLAEARTAYRRLLRSHHPDIAGAGSTARAARLTEAFAVLEAANERAAEHPPDTPPRPTPSRVPGPDDRVGAEQLAGDALFVHAPPDETFAAVFDAAGRVGHLAYFDRHLGLVETIVRFEGGPSCSLLLTLQGRAEGTEVFVTLESIEAAPTPPIAPVVDALVEALTAG